MPTPFDAVGEVMTTWPATVRVFLDFRLGCIGCPIGEFHSVDDACREHGIDRDQFSGGVACSQRRRSRLKWG